MMILQFSQPKGISYQFVKPTAKEFGGQPHLSDLLSTKYIFINKSERYPLAGKVYDASLSLLSLMISCQCV